MNNINFVIPSNRADLIEESSESYYVDEVISYSALKEHLKSKQHLTYSFS